MPVIKPLLGKVYAKVRCHTTLEENSDYKIHTSRSPSIRGS
jgi:hypothetical protein